MEGRKVRKKGGMEKVGRTEGKDQEGRNEQGWIVERGKDRKNSERDRKRRSYWWLAGR